MWSLVSIIGYVSNFCSANSDTHFGLRTHRHGCIYTGHSNPLLEVALYHWSCELATRSLNTSKNLMRHAYLSTTSMYVLKMWILSSCCIIYYPHSVSASVSEISNYLSLGSCMEGLKLLTEKLYGITLQDVTPDPGECWHSSVHKLQVNCAL